MGHSEGEKWPRGEETKELGKDVYTFPVDSDPESPAPAPWAQCTFIQRCRKKRVLLRPFSGLGTSRRTSPETGERATASPPKPQSAETAGRLDGGAEVCGFEEAGFGEAAAEEPTKFGGKGDEEAEEEPGDEIFTCVECSIYFKKQVHLQEHIVEHCLSGAPGGGRSGKSGRFRCVECGWDLPNRLALADHHKRHQESRLKILEEIEKLNGNGKARGIQKFDGKSSDAAAVMRDAGKTLDPEPATCPSLPPATVSTPDPAVLDSDAAPPNSVRCPAPVRGAAAGRRRFICTKCHFSTRTPQALANHIKTHNRKKLADPQSPGPPSVSLACGHCAFLTSSHTVMREHQKLVHPVEVSSGALADETGQRLRSHEGAQIPKPGLDSDRLAGSGSSHDATRGESQQGAAASEGGTTPDGAAARPASQVVFKRTGNRRFSKRGKAWTDLAKFLEDDKLTGTKEEEQDKEPSTERSQRDANSPVGVKPHTRARSSTGETQCQTTHCHAGK